MENVKVVTGQTADEVWTKIAADIEEQEILDYDVFLKQDGLSQILLQIEIDPGGGFEGGFESTHFSAPITVNSDFRFALHHESFLDKAGKFLGLEDKIIGYDEFDKEFIIKTNNEEKVKAAFSDASVRTFFQSLQDFNLYSRHHDSGTQLELEIERGITETAELRAIYDAFCKLLLQLQQ